MGRSADAIAGNAAVKRQKALTQHYTYKPPKTTTPNTIAARQNQRPPITWETLENVAYKDAMNKLQGSGAPKLSAAPATRSSSSSGGGYGGYGGGGGGGGGGGLDKAAFERYAEAIKQLVSGMKAPTLPQAPAAMQNPLTAMVNPAVDKDIAAAREAFGRVAGEVSMNDPYLELLSRQAPQMSPELQQFANSQGVGAQYGAQAQLSQQDANQAAFNWQQLAAVLGKNFLAGQQNTIDTSKLQGENIVQGFEGDRTQLNALAALQQQQLDKAAADRAFEVQMQQAQLDAQNKQAQMQALMELMAAGLPYGVTPDVKGIV